MIPLYLALCVFLLAVIIGGAAYLWESAQMKRPGRIIYYASDIKRSGPAVKKAIEKYVLAKGEKTEDYVLVEPGAGLAHMSRYLARNYKWKRVEAVEVGSVILTFGRWWHRIISKLPVKFIRADVFNYAVDRPALIYAYLSSAMLTRLHKEGKFAGALVIALTFPIEDCEPTESIELKSWQSPLRVYDFRNEGGEVA